MRYKTMSDDELREVAKQRNKKTGSFKSTAIHAQYELYRRHQWVHENIKTDDGYLERSIEDRDYNGY